MKIPLILDTPVLNGSQFISIWNNGINKIIKSPILPYAYTKNDPPLESKNELVKRKLLYDIDNEIELWKCSFRTIYDLRNCCNSNDFYEYQFNFRDRIYVDKPDFVEQYANTDDLKILSLDIECDTYGNFSNPNENAIIAIGLQLNDNPIEIYMSKTYSADKELLLTVINRIKELDPDVFVTYNGIRFDFPYIADRCKINGISTSLFSRDGREIEHILDNKTGNYKETKIGGRCHYDILVRSVKDGQKVRDQYLFGVSPKHYDMKTIAKIYKCENVIKEPPSQMANMRSIVNTQQLHDYLESDIRCTTHLRKIYFPSLVRQAEDLIVPLDAVINMVPSYTGTIIFARKFGALGIIGDKTVKDANPELAGNKEGGWVRTFRTGLFKEEVRDIDFTSFYPSLIIQLNLCPTTTKILRTELELKPYSTKLTEDNHLQISAPDHVANRQIIIDIDMNKKGVAAEFVSELMQTRSSLKKSMKTMNIDSAEYEDANVNSTGMKVVINAISGFMGMQYSIFGSLASYIAIVSSARYILQQLVDFLNTNNDNCIAANTDGVYLTNGPSLKETHNWLEQFIKNLYYTDKSYVWLEESTYESAYFLPNAEKHYLLLSHKQDDGSQKMTIHGGGYKGGGKLQLYSDIIDEIGFKLLSDKVTKNDILKYYNSDNWDLDKITFNRNIKTRSTYKNPGDLGVQLIDQYEKRFDVELKEPTRLSFVKIKPIKNKYKKRMNEKDMIEKASEYKLVTIFDKFEDIQNLDIDYYKEEVDKALERLGLENLCPKNKTKQAGLFDF